MIDALLISPRGWDGRKREENEISVFLSLIGTLMSKLITINSISRLVSGLMAAMIPPFNIHSDSRLIVLIRGESSKASQELMGRGERKDKKKQVLKDGAEEQNRG